VVDLPDYRKRRDPYRGGPALSELARLAGHGRRYDAFYASVAGLSILHDRISLVDASLVASSHILTPGRVTDTYLLSLAKSYGGKLATFNRRLSTLVVPEGPKTLHIIGDDDR
jgi:predicted nucleic acid-binding protein